MKLKSLAALLLAFLCLLPAGCMRQDNLQETAPLQSTRPVSPSPTPANTSAGADTLFTVCYTPDADFNPYSCTSSYNRLLLPLLYEGLFALDAAFAAQPQLCSDYGVSEDGLIWTFHLLSGVTFWDGSSLTAADAAASLEAAKSSPAYSGRFSGISTFSSQTDGSLVITLTAPNSRLPCLLDIPIVKSGTAGADIPTGTGPYSFSAGAAPYLEKYARHRDSQSLPFAEIHLADAAAESLVTDLDQGLVDLFVTGLRSSRDLNFHGALETRHFCTTDLYYLAFNVADGRLFSDVQFRSDIRCALDRAQLVQDVFDGYLSASTLPIHPLSSLYDTSLAAQYDFSGTALSDHLQQRLLSDYDNDGLLERYAAGSILDFSADFIVCTEDSHKLAAARSIVRSLQDEGYPITLRELDRAAFLSALEQGDFDLYLAETMLSPDFDLQPLVHSTGSLNYGGIADPQLDTLLAAFRAAGPDRQAEAAADLLRYIGETSYILPIGFTEQALYSRPGVIQGLAPTSSNIFYGIADWSVLLTAA